MVVRQNIAAIIGFSIFMCNNFLLSGGIASVFFGLSYLYGSKQAYGSKYSYVCFGSAR